MTRFLITTCTIFTVIITIIFTGLIFTIPAAANNPSYNEPIVIPIVDKKQEKMQNVNVDAGILGTCTFVSTPGIQK